MKLSCAVVTSVAALGHGFLLPPHTLAADSGIDPLSLDQLVRTEPVIVDLPCPNCPGRPSCERDEDRTLRLIFSVQPSQDLETLTVNDLNLFPPAAIATAPELHAGEWSHGHGVDVPLSFLLTVLPEPDFVATDGTELFKMHLQVTAVHDSPVRGLDQLDVYLLRSAAGQLMLASIELTPTEDAVVPGGVFDDSCALGQYWHHRHIAHHQHGWQKLCRMVLSFFADVIFPVSIGIAAGASVGLLGVMVGRLCAVLWMRFYRGEACPLGVGRRCVMDVHGLHGVDAEDTGLLDERNDDTTDVRETPVHEKK